MEDILQVLQTSWPILLMVVIFYFLLWRPQKKQIKKERANLLRQLEKRSKNRYYWRYLWRNRRT